MGLLPLPSTATPLSDKALSMKLRIIVTAAFTIAVFSLPTWAAPARRRTTGGWEYHLGG